MATFDGGRVVHINPGRGGRVVSEVVLLVLEDGSVFRGEPFGARVDAEAEVVFGHLYDRLPGDPRLQLLRSAGQMVCMTYPLIGNYGVVGEDYARVPGSRP